MTVMRSERRFLDIFQSIPARFRREHVACVSHITSSDASSILSPSPGLTFRHAMAHPMDAGQSY